MKFWFALSLLKLGWLLCQTATELEGPNLEKFAESEKKRKNSLIFSTSQGCFCYGKHKEKYIIKYRPMVVCICLKIILKESKLSKNIYKYQSINWYLSIYLYVYVYISQVYIYIVTVLKLEKCKDNVTKRKNLLFAALNNLCR